jgi:hypothetical protein
VSTKQDTVVARVQLPRFLWQWVRGQALLEGLSSGKLLELAIGEYRAKKLDEQYRKLGDQVSKG